MRFQLEWGKHEKHLLAQQKAGVQVAALDNAPELDEWLYCYWKAFNELNPTRNISEAGPSGILVSEIVAWLDLNCIPDPESRCEFLFYIRQIDIEFLAYSSEKQREQHDRHKQEMQKAKSKARR